jgi:hypothetical protein
VFNPGTSVTNSGYFVADIVLTAEMAYADHDISMMEFTSSYPAAQQVVMLYARPDSPTDLIVMLAGDGLGWVYFSDEDLPTHTQAHPRTWTTRPTMWTVSTRQQLQLFRVCPDS